MAQSEWEQYKRDWKPLATYKAVKPKPSNQTLILNYLGIAIPLLLLGTFIYLLVRKRQELKRMSLFIPLLIALLFSALAATMVYKLSVSWLTGKYVYPAIFSQGVRLFYLYLTSAAAFIGIWYLLRRNKADKNP
ncbi:MAG: hypothetical protein Q8L35_07295 [Actinomycetota bacterium]|nr:hypothetical protein [Actinomycetota bacterium]